MRSSLSLSARWLFFACAVCFPLYGQKPANPVRTAKATKSAKAKNDKLAVPLPDAYSGVAYNNNKITGALGLSTGGLHCADPTSALPDGSAASE